MDLDRLRELAREPERTAMPKGPLPSMTDQVFALKQENSALRRGLHEAIEEIEHRGSLVALLRRFAEELQPGVHDDWWIDNHFNLTEGEVLLLEQNSIL